MSGSMSAAEFRALRVKIPATPDRVLSPNSRVHWSIRMKAKNELGTATYLAMRPPAAPVWGSAEDWALWAGIPLTLSWTVYWGKGRKRQDVDNLIASLKAAQDAIATRLCIDDKYFRIGAVEQRRDPDGLGYMEVVIAPAALAGTEATG